MDKQLATIDFDEIETLTPKTRAKLQERAGQYLNERQKLFEMMARFNVAAEEAQKVVATANAYFTTALIELQDLVVNIDNQLNVIDTLLVMPEKDQGLH